MNCSCKFPQYQELIANCKHCRSIYSLPCLHWDWEQQSQSANVSRISALNPINQRQNGAKPAMTSNCGTLLFCHNIVLWNSLDTSLLWDATHDGAAMMNILGLGINLDTWDAGLNLICFHAFLMLPLRSQTHFHIPCLLFEAVPYLRFLNLLPVCLRVTSVCKLREYVSILGFWVSVTFVIQFTLLLLVVHCVSHASCIVGKKKNMLLIPDLSCVLNHSMICFLRKWRFSMY